MPQCNNVNGDWVFLVLVDNGDLKENILKEYLKEIEHFKQKDQMLLEWTWFKATKRTTGKELSKLKSQK